MDAGSNAYTRELPVHDVPAPSIDHRMAMTAEKLHTDFSKVETMIQRFPRGLRGIGGDNDRYIVPSVVAIGPYHHGLPQLQKMEEVKLAAAYYVCTYSCRSGAEVYEKVLSIVGEARGCYDADDPAVMGLSDAEFATMMFLDGCFLLQYMVGGGDEPVLQNRMTLSTGPSIQKDIFMLENQIPLLVLEVLTEFMNVDVRRFVIGMGDKCLPFPRKGRRRCGCIPTALAKTTRPSHEESRGVGSTEQHKPLHLLGLLRFTQVSSMPEQVRNYTGVWPSWSSSAVELAQMGVKLTPSTEVWFGDMRLRRHLFGGELSLSPLFLNDVTACWIVNIAALEASNSGAARDTDGYVVSSYMSVLAMLMDGEEDVQQLRAKHVLYGTLSNKQALRFFKGLAQHLRFGHRYLSLLEEIDSYKRHRSLRISIHRLLYNSFKAMTIATLFSIVGVLVGIFKTLLDNRKK